MFYCEVCGARYSLKLRLPIRCACGYTIRAQDDYLIARPRLCKTRSRLPQVTSFEKDGDALIDICRSNKCGKYLREKDACQVVIEKGLKKGLQKPGAVTWLKRHSGAKCPNNPPMWTDRKVARFGFLSPVYNEIGGTETWHRALLPHIPDSGFVSVSEAVGNLSLLSCWTGVGHEAAKRLASSVDVLVVWGMGSSLLGVLPEHRPKVVTVNHTDSRSSWGSDVVAQQSVVSDAVVSVNTSGLLCVPDSFTGVRKVISNCVDVKRIETTLTKEEAKSLLGAKRGDRVIVAVSRFSLEKRLSLLAHASRFLPEGYRVFVVGQSSGSDLSCASELRSLQTDKFTVLPFIDPPANVFKAADCYVSCSSFEGFGLSSVEAVASGVPVVSTRVGVFEDYPDLCFGVDYDISPSSLATKIVSVCGVSEEFKASAKSFVIDKFSLSAFVGSWRSLLFGLVDDKSR